MSGPAYIHGTSTSEQARLTELNRLTNPAFLQFLQVMPGIKVLEVGSGLGILAAEVAAAAAGVQVVGLERSAEQIAAATSHPGVSYVQGDAVSLPFPDASFDLVYARYLLEHVADPGRVVSEMRRVARPGGRVAVMENDISLLRVDPPCMGFNAIWTAFTQYQWQLGGDALIGRRLFRLLKSAGFEQIELSVQPEIHWSGSPGFQAWIANLGGNIESAREGLAKAGLCNADQIARAQRELEQFAKKENASTTFVWNRAMAVR
jgi:ubiquinone/menaquinone biosynthesis C-methylase UbiE